jgi:hypothetical protein
MFRVISISSLRPQLYRSLLAGFLEAHLGNVHFGCVSVGHPGDDDATVALVEPMCRPFDIIERDRTCLAVSTDILGRVRDYDHYDAVLLCEPLEGASTVLRDGSCC